MINVSTGPSYPVLRTYHKKLYKIELKIKYHTDYILLSNYFFTTDHCHSWWLISAGNVSKHVVGQRINTPLVPHVHSVYREWVSEWACERTNEWVSERASGWASERAGERASEWLSSTALSEWASEWVSEWVIKFNGLSEDSKVHIIHISRVIAAYSLELLLIWLVIGDGNSTSVYNGTKP